MRRVRLRTTGYVVRETPAPVDARQLALELASIMKGGDKAAPTLGEFAPRWLREHAEANRQKPRGIDSKRSILDTHLLPRFGDRPLNRLTSTDIQELKAALSNRSPKTVNNVLTVLNRLLKSAVEWNVLERLPVDIELLDTQDPEAAFYEFEDYERLVAAARRIDIRAFVLVLLGGDAGLRMGEIIAREWRCVDFRRETLLVDTSESQGIVTVPKGGRSRKVPMTTRLFEALQALCRLRGPEARLLLREDGRTVSQRVLCTLMGRAQREAGLPVTQSLHVLRHTFCSHLAMRGAPALAIKEYAGHSSIRTTERYMHLAPHAGRHAIRLLESGGHGISVSPDPDPARSTGLEPVPLKTRPKSLPVKRNRYARNSLGHPPHRDEMDALAVLRSALYGSEGEE